MFLFLCSKLFFLLITLPFIIIIKNLFHLLTLCRYLLRLPLWSFMMNELVDEKWRTGESKSVHKPIKLRHSLWCRSASYDGKRMKLDSLFRETLWQFLERWSVGIPSGRSGQLSFELWNSNEQLCVSMEKVNRMREAENLAHNKLFQTWSNSNFLDVALGWNSNFQI